MECSFCAHTAGGDAAEQFFIFIGKQWVDSAGGHGHFEFVGTFDIPGGENDLALQCAFDGAGGVEFQVEGPGESVESLVIFRVSSTACCALNPSLMALAEERALPPGVVGPVLCWAFAVLAMICAGVAIAVSPVFIFAGECKRSAFGWLASC